MSHLEATPSFITSSSDLTAGVWLIEKTDDSNQSAFWTILTVSEIEGLERKHQNHKDFQLLVPPSSEAWALCYPTELPAGSGQHPAGDCF